MTEVHQQNERFDFRAFMLKHQYKVMLVSVVAGFMWVEIHHGREFGPFLWWDKSDVVLTTRRPRRLEKVEFVVMAVLWAAILVFVIVVIFHFSR